MQIQTLLDFQVVPPGFDVRTSNMQGSILNLEVNRDPPQLIKYHMQTWLDLRLSRAALNSVNGASHMCLIK